MHKISKRLSGVKEEARALGVADLSAALKFVVKKASAKFDEAVDVAVCLGIDPSKGEQSVRGSTLLPHGLGKKVRVLVFAKGEHEAIAQKAGADYVGGDDLVQKILGGWLEFDAAVATPDMMGLVGQVARVLGPRGLLPNNKVGTVTFDVASIVKDLKQGRASFRNDKGGVLHASFGRVSFGIEKLQENFVALMQALRACRPASAKGIFIKKITLSSTMGAGVSVNPHEYV